MMSIPREPDPYIDRPIMTADNRPWVQRCYVCKRTVNFLTMKWGAEWLRIGQFVRHKKCKPETVR